MSPWHPEHRCTYCCLPRCRSLTVVPGHTCAARTASAAFGSGRRAAHPATTAPPTSATASRRRPHPREPPPRAGLDRATSMLSMLRLILTIDLQDTRERGCGQPPSAMHGPNHLTRRTTAPPIGAPGRTFGSGCRGEPGSARRLEREREARAAGRRRVGPDAAAVAIYDAADDREPDARPFEVRGLVKALERLEQARGEGRVEADPIVPHEVDRLLGARDAHLEAGAGTLSRELPGVAEQILEDDLQEPRIAARLERRGHDELDVARR